MPGWRDRAVRIPDANAAPPGSTWRDRAEVVQTTQAIPETSMTSKASSALKGAEQGVTLGFADELGAAGQAYLQNLANQAPEGSLEFLGIDNRYEQSPLETYKDARSENRAIYRKAQRENPGAYIAGEVIGGTLLPVPGGATAGATRAAKILGSAKTGAAMGGAYGLGSSEADLTKGEVGQAALDTGAGALFGGAAGAGMEGLIQGGSKVIQQIRDRARRGVDDAVAAERATQDALKARDIASKQGQYRSEVQSASRDLEVLAREADNLPEGQLRRSVVEGLNSPEGFKVREMVAANKLETMPDRVANVQKLKSELDSLVATKEPSIDLATREALRDPIKKHLAPRLWTLGHRAIPIGIAAAGGAMGGVEGAAVAGTLGTIYSLYQGRPGVIIKNLMKTPAARKAFWEKVAAGTGANAPRFVSALEAAAQRSEQAFKTTAYVLGQRHPEVRKMLEQFANWKSDAENIADDGSDRDQRGRLMGE